MTQRGSDIVALAFHKRISEFYLSPRECNSQLHSMKD